MCHIFQKSTKQLIINRDHGYVSNDINFFKTEKGLFLFRSPYILYHWKIESDP